MTATDSVSMVSDEKFLKLLIDDLKGRAKAVVDVCPVGDLAIPQAQPTMPSGQVQDDLVHIGQAFRSVHGDAGAAPEFIQLLKRCCQTEDVCCISISEGLSALSSQISQLQLRVPVFSG